MAGLPEDEPMLLWSGVGETEDDGDCPRESIINQTLRLAYLSIQWLLWRSPKSVHMRCHKNKKVVYWWCLRKDGEVLGGGRGRGGGKEEEGEEEEEEAEEEEEEEENDDNDDDDYDGDDGDDDDDDCDDNDGGDEEDNDCNANDDNVNDDVDVRHQPPNPKQNEALSAFDSGLCFCVPQLPAEHCEFPLYVDPTTLLVIHFFVHK